MNWGQHEEFKEVLNVVQHNYGLEISFLEYVMCILSRLLWRKTSGEFIDVNAQRKVQYSSELYSVV